jgi:hypothetical protein
MPPPPARVAVVVVHGVGSPAPLSTARAAAELLIQYQPNEAEFGPFAERRLIIPTEPLPVTPSAPTAAADRNVHRAGSTMYQLASDRSFVGRNQEEASAADVAFMRSQLEGYSSEREPYATAELIGERRDRTGARTGVHVFEMHWADLSRMGSGLLRVLGAVYQLILHISHLGRKTLDIGSQFAPDPEDQALNESWRRFSSWHASAVQLFAIGVPVATLLMFSSTVFFIPAGLHDAARPVAGIVMGVIVALAAACFVCFIRIRATAAANACAIACVAIVGGGVWLWWRLPAHAELLGTGVLTVSLGVLLLVAYAALLARYDRAQPGALGVGRAGALVVMAFTVVSCIVLPSHRELGSAEWVRRAAFFAFQWSYVLLTATWIVLWTVASMAFVLGLRVWMLTPSAAARSRLSRAAWTARATLGFSLFAFTIAVLVGYQTILTLATAHTTYVDLLPAAPLQAVSTWFLPSGTGSVADFFQALIAEGGTSALPHMVVGVAVSLLLFGWFIALIALTSISTPRPDWRFAQQLGVWFTSGFRWLRRAGNLATGVIVTGCVIGGIVTFAPAIFHFQWDGSVTHFFDPQRTAGLVRSLAYALLASAATVAAVQVRLAAITTQARPAIGIILDVDHYLRERPRDSTPRARMAERFASLLNQITERTNDDGTPFFDRIVLVSHSQGTVITADFLRFVAAERIARPVISASRFRLLTMGSPLRQLYAQHFPYLYGWIDAGADAAPPLASGAVDGKSPDPAGLRVAKWVNLYTSGDYVGRTLWRYEDAERVWMREGFDEANDTGSQRERCLGAGTHTHYWTSADVAEEMDALMTR